MRRLYCASMVVFLLALFSIRLLAQETVTVTTPVSGTLLVANGRVPNKNLLAIDTQSGSANVLADIALDNIQWDSLGQRISFTQLFDLSILEIASMHEINADFSEYGHDFWLPIGWSNDDASILFAGVDANFPSSQYSFYEVNLVTNTPSLIWTFSTNETLAELSAYPEVA